MGFWGDFQGLNEATGGGWGVQKFENWGYVVYGWSLKYLSLWPKFSVPDDWCTDVHP